MRLARTLLVTVATALGACSLLVDQSGLQSGEGPDGGGTSASSSSGKTSSSSSASSGGSSSGGSSSGGSSSGASSSSSSSSGARDAAVDACGALNSSCNTMADCCSGKCSQERRCKTSCAPLGDGCFLTNGCCVGTYCGSPPSGTPECVACRKKGETADQLAFPPASSCCSGDVGNDNKCT